MLRFGRTPYLTDRWAFAEFRDVYEVEADFARRVAAEFDRMIAA